MKTTWMTLALAVVAGWTAMIAFGEDLVQAPEAVTVSPAQSAEHWIGQLGHEKAEVRQEAQRVLERMGPSAAPALKRAMAQSDQPEIRHRCRGLLAKIQLGKDFKGAEAVNGLKWVVDAPVVRLANGQTVFIESRLLNVSNHPIKLQVGYSTCGNYFEGGSVIKGAALKVTGESKPSKPSWRVGFCGTGAYPLKKILMPGESIAYQMPVQFVSQPKAAPVKKGRAFGSPITDGLKLGKQGYMVINLNGADEVELSIAHTVKGKEGFGFRGQPFQKNNAQSVDPAGTVWWNGTLKPNTLTLKIDRAVGKDAQANKG